MPPAYRATEPLAWRRQALTPAARLVAEETPVAITYNGSTHAVMMATPLDLEDFAVGFSRTEDIIDSINDIDELEVQDVEGGVDVRIWLKSQVFERRLRRQRRIFGPVGCGLCGVESIAEALKPAAAVTSELRVKPATVMAGMSALRASQSLNEKTRAVHAAALYSPQGGILAREDVGRHNALDKVFGAALRQGTKVETNVALITSRVSVELVQKAARLGVCVIAAVSAPTALAIRVANAARITVVAIVRDDGFEVFTHPERIGEAA